MAITPYGDGCWELGLHGYVWPHDSAIAYGNGP